MGRHEFIVCEYICTLCNCTHCISRDYKPNNSARLGNEGKNPNPLDGCLEGGLKLGPIPGCTDCGCNCGGTLFGLFPIPLGPARKPLGLGPEPKPLLLSLNRGSFCPGSLSFVGEVGLFGKVPCTGSFDVGLCNKR